MASLGVMELIKTRKQCNNEFLWKLEVVKFVCWHFLFVGLVHNWNFPNKYTWLAEHEPCPLCQAQFVFVEYQTTDDLGPFC